ncbi:hypothetical protein [Motiliproteus coralliicola]|nr:hypothetical protein [Motiliproteus coralliicola]
MAVYALTCGRCGGINLKDKGPHRQKREYRCYDCGHTTTKFELKAVKPKTIAPFEEHQLKKQIREATKETREAHKQIEELKHSLGIANELTDTSLQPPEWLQSNPASAQDAVSVAFLSDTHFDEVVDPAEINFVNAYNRTIAENRLRTFFNIAVDIASDPGRNLRTSGFVLPLGGDIVGGNIHEELARTNEAGIMDTVIHWSNEIAAGIEQLADKFDRVTVPCVTGNHGRNTLKPINKGRTGDNFDYLIYRLLERHFRKDRRVSFIIPRSIAAKWNVYGHRFHLEHGDNGFRGGNGIAGIWSPIMRGDMKLRQREQAVDQEYDTLMLGHFHQLKWGGHFIMNGSLKGIDDYASNGKFGYEQPQQAFFMVDAKGQIVNMNSIQVARDEDYEGVSVFEVTA